ncbi:hypothetical protein ACWD4V_17555 [Streptomyces tsukubensis]
MSGSPKYSSVGVGALYAQREAAERRRRAEERRARERRRAAERERLARDAERRRAAAARREAEVAARRAAERTAQEARVRAGQARADERALDELRGLLTEARRSGARADLGSLEGELTGLRLRAARGEPLGGAVEELRGRIVDRSPMATGTRTEDRTATLAALDRRLAATGRDGPALDADGHRACTDLLEQLRDAGAPGREVRFEALLGTVEHALTRHTVTVTEALAAAEREARTARERAAADEAERVRSETAAAEREAAAEKAVETALAEAAERLGVVREAAEAVVAAAVELGDPDLAGEIGDALRAVTGALAGRSPAEARTAVADLERRLPDAEGRLDELELAYERRRDLVEALRDAMTGEGFAFEGGEDDGGSFRLHFSRPTGAMYETTVATGDDGAPVLVYHVDGEPDTTLTAGQGEAVCDTTEALLERVHLALGGDDGFVAGELTWDGKPPDRRAEPLPGGTVRWWTSP